MNKLIHDINLEKEVFGLAVQNAEFYYRISDMIDEEDFYDNDFSQCYKHIRTVHDSGGIPNQVDLYKFVRDNNLDQSKILDATSNCSMVASITLNHSYKMKEYSYLRKLASLAMKVGKSAYDKNADCFEIMASVQEEVTQMELGIRRSNIEHIKDIGMQGLKNIYTTVAQKDVKPVAVPSFSKKLNEMSGGFIKGGLSVIAGLPGGGKSCFAFQCALHQIQTGYNVGLISLEMSKDHVYKRLLSNVAHIDGYSIRDGRLDKDALMQINKSTNELIKHNLFIADDPYIDRQKLRPIIRQFVKKHQCQIVFIDYFQLIGNDAGKYNTAEANQQLTQHLQKIAREFNIPIVCLSQLNRQEGRPNMNSLRGGGIEQATDLIVMLYDPNYNSKEDVHDMDTTKADITAIVAKCKHGSIGDVPIHYNKVYQTMEDGQLTGIQQYHAKNLVNDELF